MLPIHIPHANPKSGKAPREHLEEKHNLTCPTLQQLGAIQVHPHVEEELELFSKSIVFSSLKFFQLKTDIS